LETVEKRSAIDKHCRKGPTQQY